MILLPMNNVFNISITNMFMGETADEITISKIINTVRNLFPDEYINKVSCTFENNEIRNAVCISLEFETKEDIVAFKLKHGV